MDRKTDGGLDSMPVPGGLLLQGQEQTMSVVRRTTPDSSSTRVLVVDDEPMIRESLAEFLNGEGFHCDTAGTGAHALEKLDLGNFGLIIADIQMPDLDGLQLLAQVSNSHPDISIMMITGISDVNTAVLSMKQGACDYLTKPFNIDTVLASVNRAFSLRRIRLETKRNAANLEGFVRKRSAALQSVLQELKEHRSMTMDALLKTLDARGHETHSHSMRVQAYAVRLGEEFGFRNGKMLELAQGALLHDIGKIGINDQILLKPGPLTPEERTLMQSHSVIGHRILKSVKFLDGAAHLALHHHERYDGQGYPMKLKGDQIPLEARIFAVLDTFDAMTSDRPYQSKRPSETARTEISEKSGSQFDPMVVREFLKLPIQDLDKIRMTYL